MTEQELLAQRWYAVLDNTIGGWAVANVDKTTAEMDHRIGEVDVAWGLSPEVARHIAELHNRWLDGGQQ